jgi:prepilin-type N-terminal cleavage/methylation domain-containing protein
MQVRHQRGFTLIEVMMTIMIAGVLATATTPLVTHSIQKARRTEAMAGLGAVRRAMRMYYIEHGTYKDPQFTPGRKVTFAQILPLTDTDLEGRYFSSDSYTFERVKRRTYRITCRGSDSTAPSADAVAGMTLHINQKGDIWTGGASDGGPIVLLATSCGGSG